MDALLRDVRYALRQLTNRKGFTVSVALILGLGVGASSAIFCLMDGLWLHPIQATAPGRLVRIFSTTEQQKDGLFSYPEYNILAERTRPRLALAALGRRGSLLPHADGTSTLLLTNVVTSNFFDTVGVHAFRGRLFGASDGERLRLHPAVVLGYRCWRRYFNQSPDIVGTLIGLQLSEGKTVYVDVLGVLPPDFREIDVGTDSDVWMSVDSWSALAPGADLAEMDSRWFTLLGRLAPGVAVKTVNSEVSEIAGALAQQSPATNRGRSARSISDFDYRLGQAGMTGMLLFAVVGCVILLAVVNVSHLLLARGLDREREVTLRISLGASRLQVARELVLENVTLCLLGLGVGIAVAAAVARALPHLVITEPTTLDSLSQQAANTFLVDFRVFIFAAALALFTAIVLALVPLNQVYRPELLPALQTSGSSRATSRISLLRNGAVCIQIAFSFALLVTTGSLVRSFLNTRKASIGLTRHQVLLALSQQPGLDTRQEVLSRMAGFPGVSEVAYGIRAPLMPVENDIAINVWFPDHPDIHTPTEIKFNAVSSAFLNVTGTRILRGQGFSAENDADGSVAVVVIDEAMARKFWSGINPLGRVIQIGKGKISARIVGISENAPISQMGELPEPYLYVPFSVYEKSLPNMGEITYALRTGPNAMSMASAIRKVLVRINPNLDPLIVTSLPELIRYSSANYQMTAELTTALGAVGVLLTMAGFYGVLAFRVTRRKREIGIRMALGASRASTTKLVAGDASRLVAVGLGIGLLLSGVGARFESSVLFGVRPLDWISLFTAFGLTILALTGAAWLPAQRAAAVDPLEMLRTE